MKKILFVLTLVCFFIITNKLTAGSSVGLKGGLSTSDIKYTSETNGDSASGNSVKDTSFSYGLFFELGKNGPVYFQPEFMMTTRRAAVDMGGVTSSLFFLSSTSGPGDLKLTFLDIPLLIKVKLNEVPYVKPYFLIGPYFGILLGAEMYDTDISDDYNPIEVGGLGGIGVEYPFEKLPLAGFMELRYQLAFTKILNKDDTKEVSGITTGNKRSAKTKALQFYVGFSYKM